MATTVRSSAGIFERYAAERPNSRRAFEKARTLLPDGVEHDMRIAHPFPLYIERADGAYKWDIDGHRYVDYVVGHGALLLGQNHPAVMGPVREALKRGSHFGASHEAVAEWADLVREMIPSAEMVRFHSSGTEATMMAVRMCRTFTGRDKILKFDEHFHGWHDYVTNSVYPPLDIPMSSGVPGVVRDLVTAIPVNDADLVRQTLSAGDYACVILEPSGAGGGGTPTDVEWVRQLRAICTELDVPLIFDEVITGFRFGPGGYQQEFGITPDMTTLAKILAGGFPGGAVTGQRKFVSQIEMRDETGWNRGGRISHQGTFNANPLSAAAGVACLEQIADGNAHATANAAAERLRIGFNRVIGEHGIDAHTYGSHSFFYVSFNGREDRTAMGAIGGPLKTAMMLHGVHWGAMTSAALTEDDTDLTIDALDKSLKMVAAEGLLT